VNAACISALLAILAQDASDEAALKELLHPFYGRQAAAYEFFKDADRKQALKLRQQPVLTWTNVEKYMGAVFVWEFGGRPEVIGCIGSHQFANDKSMVFHEFHSLSLQPLQTVKFGGTRSWTPAKPGLEMAPATGAAAPADSDRQRLTQMRAIAREFRGWMKDNDDVTELRLLPQPIIRYSAAEQGVRDGAIFALVWKGTDPEILLVEEDRKRETGQRWEYGLARFNYREMWASRNDREVWRVEVNRVNENYITGVTGNYSHDAIRQEAAAANR